MSILKTIVVLTFSPALVPVLLIALLCWLSIGLGGHATGTGIFAKPKG